MMTLDEIMAKAKSIYEHVEDINTLAEARQAVKDGSSMMYYLARHIAELVKKEGDQHLPPQMD